MQDLPKQTLLETAKPNQDVLVELFELDLTHIGGDLFRFHSGMNEIRSSVKWQGKIYEPYPIEASGFEFNGQGTSNRPTLTAANITGLVTGLSQDYDDLVGAIVTRRQMYSKFLDADNFLEGNPQADPTQELVSRYVVERMTALEADFAKFELALPCESDGALLPARAIIADTCNWIYRSSECGYTGGAVADEFDNPMTDPACDKCGKRLTSCKLRFGKSNPLPFGGFPSVSKMSR
ncbi:phage minor tail protein L [Budviciaceae bacterium BWR-B9]|uniref:Phage minor tail protein L n=1 Tax=Limnobaculum allomyrinae TaxID=2791986 RepID=A0ABS1IW65_9GAMM|nr:MULTISPECIES: phage minor tail protein L [Limnobaculum]MBK5146013.1 phage minor tail protein L [Limnobaculum allomyrinae]MBV7694054.1 phage minor tail protein L [Limnobaculum sp. M2-1]